MKNINKYKRLKNETKELNEDGKNKIIKEEIDEENEDELQKKRR